MWFMVYCHFLRGAAGRIIDGPISLYNSKEEEKDERKKEEKEEEEKGRSRVSWINALASLPSSHPYDEQIHVDNSFLFFSPCREHLSNMSSLSTLLN